MNIIIKKSWLLLILIMLPVALSAQGLQKICDKYEGMKGVESVNISPKAFAVLMRDGSNAEDAELFKKMSALRIISIPRRGATHSTAQAFCSDIDNYLKNSDMEQLMRASDGNEKMIIYHSDGELLFYATSDTEFTAIYISGTIDQSIISAVAEGKISIE